MKLSIIVLLASLMLSFSAFGASAAVFSGNGDESYSYDGSLNAITTPMGYRLNKVVDKDTIGVNSLTNMVDIFAYNDRLYLLDKSNSSIVVVNGDYMASIITSETEFNNPQSIFIKNDVIYVADTENGRIVLMDMSGKTKSIVEAPDKGVTLSTVDFQPQRIVVDNDNRIYVIAKDDTNGIMQFDDKGKFIGYFGSVPVVPDALELLWRKFSTKEQLSRMLLFVPTEYAGMTIDSTGFIYVTTANNNKDEMMSYIKSNGSDSTLAPIRKLNPKSKDILIRKGTMPPAGDYFGGAGNEVKNASRFIDVAVREDNFYCVLDSTLSHVFTYDPYGNLLSVFGSNGESWAEFKNAVGLVYWNNGIAILDQGSGEIKIFSPTEYQVLLEKAFSYEVTGKYTEAKDCWQKVLNINSESVSAKLGIGKSYMRNGDYTKAMEWFKKADNKTYYSKAFKMQRKEVGFTVFGSVISILVGIFIVYTIAKAVIKKKGIKPPERLIRFGEKTSGIRYGFYIITHPFNGFHDMKMEKMGDALSASVILIAVLLLNVLGFLTKGYLVGEGGASNENLLIKSILSLIVPLFLWCVANWSVTTLMSGSGTFKDVYMYSCYALTPMLIITPIQIILSNCLSLDELGIYNIVGILMYIWVGFLIFAGTSVIHQYSAGKTVISIIIVVVAIGIILFLVLLFASIIEQITTFLSLLIDEIQLRW